MDQHFRFTPAVLLTPLLFVLLLWIAFWIELRWNLDLTVIGILPRHLEGLPGIALSWLAHGNIEHLYNNSLPLLVLLAALVYFYRKFALKVLFIGILASGAITWIIGRESYHVGASGLIYALVSFIFFKGVRTGYYRLIALSLLAVFLYGSMVWYVFPGIEQRISWEGHLGGLVAGFVMALRYKSDDYSPPLLYDWQKPDYDPSQDKFMQRFDENGNFVNPPPPEPEIAEEVKIVYHYIAPERVQVSPERSKNQDEDDNRCRITS